MPFAGVLAAGIGVGIGGAAYASSSSDTYNGMMCGRIAGGLFAIGTGILVAVELSKKNPHAASLPCTPSLGGAVCSFRF